MIIGLVFLALVLVFTVWYVRQMGERSFSPCPRFGEYFGALAFGPVLIGIIGLILIWLGWFLGWNYASSLVASFFWSAILALVSSVAFVVLLFASVISYNYYHPTTVDDV